MDDDELRFERCGLCQFVFCVCRPCYRGQGFCGPPCKLAARATSKRAARARHRASDEGRLDHRDHERARRKRVREAETASVADHGPAFLSSVASVCPPHDPPAPMSGAVAIDGEGHDDETRTDGFTDDDRRADPDPGADGRRRGAQGSLAAVLGAAPSGHSDAARGDGAVAPSAGASCRFCSRRGVVVRAWARRRARRRRDDRPLHRRDARAGP